MRTRPDQQTRAAAVSEDDRWFTIEQLSEYSSFSPQTIRRYMADPRRPLPYRRIHAVGKARGLLRFSKREFDAWMNSFPGLKPEPELAAADSETRSWIRTLAKK
jgi:hypothetical protein